jgi:hypothetical protein
VLGALAVVACLPARARAEIVITEIHYAPTDDTGAVRSDLEFVELFNDGPEPYDLFRYRFTEGITWEFTDRETSILPGRSYLVVCRDAAAVSAYYGIANTRGNFQGILDNSGEDLTLANPQGIPVSSVAYNDRGRWPTGAKGTGHSLALRNPYSDPSEPESWTLSARMGGTPGGPNFMDQPSFRDTILIDAGATWRYFKGTQEASNPTGAWRQAGFADGSWLSGRTGIGYGDGDDQTVLNDMENGYLTVFMRRTFTVADLSSLNDLVIDVTYDDGFTAFLNGTQVAARNVGGTAFNVAADDAIEPTRESIDISAFKDRLVQGTNVLAVQVHNSGLGSSDLSMVPRLLSREVILPEEIQTVPVVVNEAFLLDQGAGRFIELYNPSGTAVNLSGYFLSDDFTSLQKFAIPGGSTIPGRGFLSFSEAQLGFDLSIAPVTRERVSIALTNPAGTRVVDAFIFEPHVAGRSEARLPDGDRRFAAAADPTPGTANRAGVTRDVVINEILYHPLSGDDVDEFVELHNRGPAVVDLSAWSVDGIGLTFPEGTSIAAGAFLVLSKSPPYLRNRYGLPQSVVFPTRYLGTLRNAGERLSLIDRNGNIADSVRYHDGGEWPIWPDGGGSSLELIDADADHDHPGSWDASDDSGEATVQTIEYGPVPYGGGESDFGMMLAQEGIVIIDDVTVIPAAGGANLISNWTFDQNTTPWRIEGTHIRSGRTTQAAERITGAGSLKLICWNGSGDYKVNRIETDTANQTGAYVVSYKARWVVGSPRIITIGDYSVASPGNSGLAGSNEVLPSETLGTPGAVNSVTAKRIAATGSDNIGPSIDLAAHSPPIPESGEEVTVTARVRDPDGVAAVRLRFRTETPEGAFTEVAMTDPDGDRVFTGRIPGQSLGTRVLFFIEATDGQAAVSRFPADLMKRTHPPVLNPASPPANASRYAMYRHDTRQASSGPHDYRFILNQTSEDYLRTRKTHSNEMVDGTFVFGGTDVYYNAQIRFSGSPWLRQGGSFGNSYSVKLPKDHLLHGRKTAFNLENHGTDGRERLSHYLLRWSAGNSLLPYFDFQSLVRFRLNDVQDATYEAVDKPNRNYLAFWFGEANDGPLFEMDDRFSFSDGGDRTGNADGHVLYPPYGPNSSGANKENYRWYFSPRANAARDDFQPLMNFCATMDQRTTPNAAFDSTASGSIDFEEILRVFAIELNIDDWDTWGGTRGKNCYFYLSTADGLWRKIPWDLELTYGNVSAFALPASIGTTYGNSFAEVTRMINRPRLKRLYYGILAEQVDLETGFFHSSFLAPYVSALAGAGVGGLAPGQSNGFIDLRANMIRNAVRASVFPQTRLEITTGGGGPLTAEEGRVDLQGNAPVDVFFLAVARNGTFLEDPPVDYSFSTTNSLMWSMPRIPLLPGVNRVQVVGLSSRGDLVDQDEIEVTAGSSWPAPEIVLVSPATGAPGETIEIFGSGFHDGLEVLFGPVAAEEVSFSEAADPTFIAARVPGLAPGAISLTVRNLDGKASNAWPFSVKEGGGSRFTRGDTNHDGSIDISDALRILQHLFSGGPGICRDAMDTNDSGVLDITDALALLDYLFRGGRPPSAPWPGEGSDPTADGIDCEVGSP